MGTWIKHMFELSDQIVIQDIELIQYLSAHGNQ